MALMNDIDYSYNQESEYYENDILELDNDLYLDDEGNIFDY
jgi:hypothetical protein